MHFRRLPLLLIGIFSLIYTGIAKGQSSAVQPISDRISALNNVEAHILKLGRAQREELKKARAKNKDILSSIPKSLRQPWVFNSTLPRRQKQNTITSKQRRQEIDKIRAAGREDPDFDGKKKIL